jgi:hypothetical protein
MGLSEFGVINSADVVILHDLLMEPAHNHLGHLRPIPYEQLVPGMYTTREFEAEEGEAVNALAAFNTELNGGEYMVENGITLKSYMETVQHLPLASMNFSPVPADATQLREVMEEFDHLLVENDNEMLNGWGVVIISEPQGNLKRVDVIISWDAVQIEGGKPVLDENGEPIPVLDANGNHVRRVNSQHIFIHRDTQYFEAPGA